jgi:hypothetical protein
MWSLLRVIFFYFPTLIYFIDIGKKLLLQNQNQNLIVMVLKLKREMVLKLKEIVGKVGIK